jgi:hypothetical protein
MKPFAYKQGLLPKTWDQMTTIQLEQLAGLVMRYSNRSDILVRAAFAFMGMRVCRPSNGMGKEPKNGYIVGKGFKRFFVTPLLVYFITDALEFIFNDNEVDPRRLANPYPTIRLGLFRKQTLHGPADGLANITLNEWIQVELERSAFNQTEKSKHLYRMAAILWRPSGAKHPEGDERKSNILDELPRRERIMRRYLKPHRLKVITWWYAGCLQYLSYKYDQVFFKADDSSGNTSTFDSFMDMVNTMSQDDPAKIQQVRSLALYDALHNIQKIVIQQNEQKNGRNRV